MGKRDDFSEILGWEVKKSFQKDCEVRNSCYFCPYKCKKVYMGNNNIGSNHEGHLGETLNTPGVYSLTLIAPNGMTQNMAAFIPSEHVLRHYIDKAHKCGLQIEIKGINESN